MTLTDEEVKQRLDECTTKEVSDELYSFGLKLLDEAVERVHRIELKASTIFGYSLTMVALVASTFSLWSTALAGFGRMSMLVAVICLLAAGFFSGRATWVKTYDWFSANEWLKEECLNDFDVLKKYRVLTIRAVVDCHDNHAAEKTRGIRRAQRALFCAGFFFFAALLVAILRARYH
jgi:hypothetical protein